MQAARNRLALLSLCLLAASSGTTARAGSELTASASATVLATGPRGGEHGTLYFNIQGKGNEKYASFGVLDFPIPKGDAGIAELKGFTLTLTQSLARFSADGKITLFLAADTGTSLDSLKFDPAKNDGLGDQFKTRYPLGSGQFKKEKTGTTETFSLTLDEAGRTYLRDAIKDGGTVRLLVVPAADGAAATYFGVGAPETIQRPKLTIAAVPESK